jgi:hypothetical protein
LTSSYAPTLTAITAAKTGAANRRVNRFVVVLNPKLISSVLLKLLLCVQLIH